MSWESYKNIPAELRDLPQWVCAKQGHKVPMIAGGDRAASPTDRSTWSDYDTALEAVKWNRYDYAGFVFADNGLVGIDIDCGWEDGLPSPTAVDIIGRCKSYTERSRSGRGFHVILKGSLPFAGKNNLAGVEIYRAARYFIMTGDVICFRDLTENQSAIDYIVETYFSAVPDSTSPEDIGNRIYRPVWPPTDGKHIALRPEYPIVPEGGRNVCMTSLAGSLHTAGYDKKQIYAELLYANQKACKPPLTIRELRSICNSVTRYKR